MTSEFKTAEALAKEIIDDLLPIDIVGELPRFDTMEQLEQAHFYLLDQQQKLVELQSLADFEKKVRQGNKDALAFLDQVRCFIHRACRIGVLLNGSDDYELRLDVQSKLNYWSSLLYSASSGQESIDSSLAWFDPAETPELLTNERPFAKLARCPSLRRERTGGWGRLFEECLRKIDEQSLLFVVGARGCGKGSLVFDALLPALKAGELTGSKAWDYLPTIDAGHELLLQLARAFKPDGEDESWVKRQAEFFDRSESQLSELIERRAAERVVIVLDGLEHLLTYSSDQAGKALLRNLIGLISEPDPRVILIAVARQQEARRIVELDDEFYLPFSNALVTVEFHTYELREAVERAANQVGLLFERGLLDRLILDHYDLPGTIGVLRFTLDAMWNDLNEAHASNRLTHDLYQEVGFAGVALERLAKSIYERCDSDQRKTITRHVFLSLAKPRPGGDVSLARLILDELTGGFPRAEVEAVLHELQTADLVRSFRFNHKDPDVYQLSHEALVKVWPTLAEWISDERDKQRRRLRLTTAAEQWHDRNRESGCLWGGSLLAEARKYPALSDLETAFLNASQAAADRATRNLYGVIVALTVALLVTVGLAAVAAWQSAAASQQRDIAKQEAQNARVAKTTADEERDRARQEAQNARIAEYKSNDNYFKWKQEYYWAQQASDEARSESKLRGGLNLLAAGDWLSSVNLFHQAMFWEQRADQSGADALNVAAGLDESALTSLSSNQDSMHRVRIGSVLELVPRLGQCLFQEQAREIVCVDVSRDGRRIVTADRFVSKNLTSAGSAEIWDAETGKRLFVLEHGNSVNQASFSPDGKTVVTACQDGIARIWDAGSGKELAQLPHAGPLTEVMFDNHGTRLLTVSPRVATVWMIDTQQVLFELKEHVAPLTHAEFNRNGDRVITCSEDKTARIWNAEWSSSETGSHEDRLVSNISEREAISWAAFSPDGELVVTACRNGTARLWKANDGRAAAPPWRHDGPVLTAVFSPDGQMVVTASEDATARVWRVPGRKDSVLQQTQVLAHGSRVHYACFSPDSRMVLTASRDTTARVWNAVSGKPVTPPLRHRGGVTYAIFGPSGARVLTCSGRVDIKDGKHAPDGGEVRVWLLNSRRSMFPTIPHEGRVSAASLSSEIITEEDLERKTTRRRLAIASTDTSPRSPGYVRIWDAERGDPLTDQIPHDLPVLAVTFSSDGKRLVTACEDGVARIWDAGTGDRIELANKISHQPDAVTQDVALTWAGYSHDGKYLLTTSRDATARLWDVATGMSLGEPLVHAEAVLFGAFSPDGKYFATASADDLARIWEINDDGKRATLVTDIPYHTADVTGVCFSPRDGRFLVTSSVDQTARVWDLQGNAVTPPIMHDRALTSAIFSPDERFVATVCQDKSVRIWDVAEHLSYHSEIRGLENENMELLHATRVNLVAPPFEHLGHVDAVTFDNQTDLLWTASSGQVLQVLEWSLAKDTRPDEEIMKAAVTLTGQVSDDQGTSNSVGFNKLQQYWEQLSEEPEFEGAFGLDANLLARSIDAWHLQQAAECEVLGLAKPAVLHLDNLLEKEPTNTRLLTRRAQAYRVSAKEGTKESELRKALADYAAAIETDLQNHYLYLDRADLYRLFASKVVQSRFTFIEQELSKSDRQELAKQLRLAAISDLTRAAEIEPSSWSAWHLRARTRAELDDLDHVRWSDVRADLEMAVKNGSNSAYTWHYLAIVCLLEGDGAAYRETCNSMGALFSDTKSAHITNRVAWASCLGPSALQESAVNRLLAMAGEQTVDRYYYLHTLGAADYRDAEKKQGEAEPGQAVEKYQLARDRIRQSIEARILLKRLQSNTSLEDEEPLDHLFLAMIHHALNDDAEASKRLAEVKQWRDKANRGEVTAPSWAERAEIEVLLREARGKIEK